MNARKFIDKVGRDAIALAVGVGKTAVSNAYTDNRFPASWFDRLDKMAKRRDLRLARNAFNWKEPKREGEAA